VDFGYGLIMSTASEKAKLIANLPGRLDRWTDLTPGSDPDKVLEVSARGTDEEVVLPLEARAADANPLTATATGIGMWEEAFGDSNTSVALYGGVEQRRAHVLTRHREHGASTRDNILASLVAMCGSTAVTLLEHRRSVLTAANWYELPSYPSIAGSANTDLSIACADNAPASRAGAQVTVRVTHASVEDLTLTIIAPDATQSSPMRFGSGSVTAQDFRFFWPGAAGKSITGNWTIRITNANATVGTVDDPAGDGITGLFVEGIGFGPYDGEGRGANIFEWCALVDEAAAVSGIYDRAAVAAVIQRWNQVHGRGYLALKNLNGGDAGVWGDSTNSCWDGFIWE